MSNHNNSIYFKKLMGKTTTFKIWIQKLKGKTTTLIFWSKDWKEKQKTNTISNFTQCRNENCSMDEKNSRRYHLFFCQNSPHFFEDYHQIWKKAADCILCDFLSYKVHCLKGTLWQKRCNTSNLERNRYNLIDGFSYFLKNE